MCFFLCVQNYGSQSAYTQYKHESSICSRLHQDHNQEKELLLFIARQRKQKKRNKITTARLRTITAGKRFLFIPLIYHIAFRYVLRLYLVIFGVFFSFSFVVCFDIARSAVFFASFWMALIGSLRMLRLFLYSRFYSVVNIKIILHIIAVCGVHAECTICVGQSACVELIITIMIAEYAHWHRRSALYAIAWNGTCTKYAHFSPLFRKLSIQITNHP